MIKSKLSVYPKILIVFDSPQSKVWVDRQQVTQDGIGAFLGHFMSAGVNLSDEVSAVCLSDSFAAKAVHYKEKEPYFRELIETHAFNVIVPVGAKAFERVMDQKGIERYFGKVVESEIYKCKVIPCPNPSMVRYKPEIKEVLADVVKLIVSEKEDSEVVNVVTKSDTDYKIITTMKEIDELINQLVSAPAIAFDLETTGFQHNVHEILTAQLTWKSGQSVLIPSTFYKNPDGTNRFWSDKQWADITRRLRTVFMRKDVLVIGHNLKFDLKFINFHWGVPIPKPKNLMDTMVMSFLTDENSANDLKYLACRMTDLGDYEFELEKYKKAYCKSNKMKVGDFNYGLIPFDILAKYALTDTDATFRLWELFKPLIEVENQLGPLTMLMRFLYTTARMELRGWPVDVEYAEKYLVELNGKIKDVEADLLTHESIEKATRILSVIQLAKDNKKRKTKLTELKKPLVFNLGSNDHKRVLFFDVLGLPIVKYTKAKNEAGKRVTPSTDKEVIAKWVFDFPKHKEFLEKIQNFSELRKMRSTYVEGILAKVVKQPDGSYRIYPLYNIIGALTGRLSSRNPNFMNLPVRNAEAKNVKRIIKAQAGWVLLGADLSAAEMRWACICSSDKKLIEIFNSGVDVHGAIAKEVFNLDCHPNEVKKMYPELRDIAKTIQFLTLFGGGAETLAVKVKISAKRSKQILEQIMQELGFVENLGKEPDLDKDGLQKTDKKTGELLEVDVWGDYDFDLMATSKAALERLMKQFSMPLDKAMKVMSSRNKVNALMAQFEIDRRDAQIILDAYFDKYKGVAKFIADTINFTKQYGYSLSLLGRKRRVPATKSDDEGVAERGIRQAVNATIQSIASDGLMTSACNLQEQEFEDDRHPMLMLGSIHDALYFEVREDYLLHARDMVIKYMTQFPEEINSPIPMCSDAEWGEDWSVMSEEFGETLAFAVDEYDEDEEEDEAA
jgi:DNA polymerase I-like protein with 3'-5' exonuclease and polymerase domains